MGLDHLFILVSEGPHGLVTVRGMGFLNSCITVSKTPNERSLSLWVSAGKWCSGGTLTDRFPFRKKLRKGKQFCLRIARIRPYFDGRVL